MVEKQDAFSDHCSLNVGVFLDWSYVVQSSHDARECNVSGSCPRQLCGHGVNDLSLLCAMLVPHECGGLSV